MKNTSRISKGSSRAFEAAKQNELENLIAAKLLAERNKEHRDNVYAKRNAMYKKAGLSGY